MIGNSLRRAVTLSASGDDLALLRRHEATLPTLFIVSEVGRRTCSDGDRPLAVTRRARRTATKCERCWRYVPAISAAAGREGLCDRCVDALAVPVEP